MVAAISQITRSPSNATAGDGSVAVATTGSPAKAGKKATDNLWIGGEDGSAGSVAMSGNAAGAKPPPGFVGHNGYNGGGAAHVDPTAVVAAAMQGCFSWNTISHVLLNVKLLTLRSKCTSS